MKSNQHRRITKYCLKPIQTWARQLSGLHNLLIVLDEKNPEDDQEMAAWIEPQDPIPIIHLDHHTLYNPKENVLFLRTYILHELGHLMNRYRSNTEYQAQLWAMTKTAELNLTQEFTLLQIMTKHWLKNKLGKHNRQYHKAALKLQHQGLI